MRSRSRSEASESDDDICSAREHQESIGDDVARQRESPPRHDREPATRTAGDQTPEVRRPRHADERPTARHHTALLNTETDAAVQDDTETGGQSGTLHPRRRNVPSSESSNSTATTHARHSSHRLPRTSKPEPTDPERSSEKLESQIAASGSTAVKASGRQSTDKHTSAASVPFIGSDSGRNCTFASLVQAQQPQGQGQGVWRRTATVQAKDTGMVLACPRKSCNASIHVRVSNFNRRHQCRSCKREVCVLVAVLDPDGEPDPSRHGAHINVNSTGQLLPRQHDDAEAKQTEPAMQADVIQSRRPKRKGWPSTDARQHQSESERLEEHSSPHSKRSSPRDSSASLLRDSGKTKRFKGNTTSSLHASEAASMQDNNSRKIAEAGSSASTPTNSQTSHGKSPSHRRHCLCGSSTHQRTSHHLCPLNDRYLNPRSNFFPGVSVGPKPNTGGSRVHVAIHQQPPLPAGSTKHPPHQPHQAAGPQPLQQHEGAVNAPSAPAIVGNVLSDPSRVHPAGASLVRPGVVERAANQTFPYGTNSDSSAHRNQQARAAVPAQALAVDPSLPQQQMQSVPHAFHRGHGVQFPSNDLLRLHQQPNSAQPQEDVSSRLPHPPPPPPPLPPPPPPRYEQQSFPGSGQLAYQGHSATPSTVPYSMYLASQQLHHAPTPSQNHVQLVESQPANVPHSLAYPQPIMADTSGFVVPAQQQHPVGMGQPYPLSGYAAASEPLQQPQQVLLHQHPMQAQASSYGYYGYPGTH